ncbi:MAG: hypothetical protein JJU15_04790 [Pararhodobacter sp.]|nr:hypothetical protein [Pararhodobacter sp.]
MIHPCQSAAIDALRVVRDSTFSGHTSESLRLVSDLHCDLSGEDAEAVVSYSSEPGSLVTLDCKVRGNMYWIGLRLDLGEGTFKPGDVLGVALQGSSLHDCSLFVNLHMVQNGVAAPTTFADKLHLSPRDTVITALHTLSALDPACAAPGWCSLVLGLPMQDFRITLHDLHFFVLPAEQGLRSEPLQLSSVSA